MGRVHNLKLDGSVSRFFPVAKKSPLPAARRDRLLVRSKYFWPTPKAAREYDERAAYENFVSLFKLVFDSKPILIQGTSCLRDFVEF